MNALKKDSALSFTPNDWNDVWSSYTYVLLQKGRAKADLQRALDRISDEQYPKGPGDKYAFRAAGLMDLMTGEPIANPTTISMPRMILVVLSVLCLVVMLSACLNYTNLSIARILTRAKEVGVRKVSGATRRQIFTQFIAEAILLSLLSLAVASLMLLLFQRLFAGLWLNQFFHISFRYTPALLLLFPGFSIVVGFVAGLLPSIYVSLFNPVMVLKGLTSFRPFKRLTLRKVLLVVQFCVSLIFIISVSLIYLQGDKVLHFDYGFNKENVVNIKMFTTSNYDRFAQAVSADKRIAAVSACVYAPATGSNSSQVVHKAAPAKDSLQADYLDVDAGVLDVWGLQLVAGRNLPRIPADKDDHYVLINERMVKDFAFGSPVGAVGQHLVLGDKDVEIVGVVKDFQFLDVNRGMEPLMLRNRKSEFGYITVKMQDRDLAGTVGFLQETWRKEISLRKVLGSSVPQVMVLLSKGFMVLLAIAVVISVPLAYIINGMWLQFFASRVSITPWILLANVLLLAGVCFLIIFTQAWKVATASPAKSLRTE
jgi:putative ABC transport system permease protein